MAFLKKKRKGKKKKRNSTAACSDKTRDLGNHRIMRTKAKSPPAVRTSIINR